MNSIAPWIESARPKTLLVGISPLLIVYAYSVSEKSFNIFVFFLLLFSTLFIQVGANFASNYYDFIQGADHEKRKGPKRALLDGSMSVNQMKKGMITLFSLAFLSSSFLIYRGGALIGLLFALSLLSALFYTKKPLSFADRGLGDLFAFLFFGPILLFFSGYLMTGNVSLFTLIIGFAPGLFSSAILNVNNVRDVDEDRLVLRRSIPVRWGRAFGVNLYLFELAAACFIPLIFYKDVPLYLFSPLFLIPSFFFYFQLKKGKNLNQILANTAKLELFHALFLSISLLIKL
ncbi:MAG: 1,4-dihydroxy-2-naphthoate octaprenyltransferase [Simkaniaceae bacterium]